MSKSSLPESSDSIVVLARDPDSDPDSDPDPDLDPNSNNFSELLKSTGMPIPTHVTNDVNGRQHQVFCYLSQLSEKDRTAYKLAFELFGTSFSLFKSVGYMTWLKTQPSVQTE